MVKIRQCENDLLCKVYCGLRVFFKVLYVAIVFLLASFILVTSYKTIDPFDKGYETQDFFGYQILDIQSDSMYPLISIGDGVMVKMVDESTEIVEGDIVAYRIGEHIIVHRVKEVVDGNAYITKGDNNDVDDGEPSPRTDIMGKYVTKIPNVHGVIQTMKTPIGIVAAFVLIFSVSKFVEYALKYPDIYFRYSDEELMDEDDEEDEEYQ